MRCLTADVVYALWPWVILNTALFMAFALSFFHPRTKRDWRDAELGYAGATSTRYIMFIMQQGEPQTACAPDWPMR